jgi:hypothetical protein
VCRQGGCQPLAKESPTRAAVLDLGLQGKRQAFYLWITPEVPASQLNRFRSA